MTTTTIRIEEALKSRVAAAAERAAKSAHAFILDAIAQAVEQVELYEEFHRVADDRWAKVLTTGKAVPWDGAKAYLEARARGECPRKPLARKLGRCQLARPASNWPERSWTTSTASSTTWPVQRLKIFQRESPRSPKQCRSWRTVR
jgi:predicted transcriptional regulator